MSRTDKTRPWAVKCLDDPSWLVEHHDHTSGEPCDLPERPTKPLKSVWGLRAETHCFWRASHEFWVDPQNHCPCPMCRDKDGRKAEARKRRHDAKIEARAERLNANGFLLVETAEELDSDDLKTPWEQDRLESKDRWNGMRTSYEKHQAAARYLDLPDGDLVVAIHEKGGIEITDDCLCEFFLAGPCWHEPSPDVVETDEFVVVEIMRADGTREERRFDMSWGEFGTAIGLVPSWTTVEEFWAAVEAAKAS
jgi:hypothetical protein